MANSTTAHTALVLPLEQFILNAFEKAPSRDKTTEREGEANSAKEEKREVEGEKETVKAHGQVRSLTFRTADGGEWVHAQTQVIAPVSEQVNVTDSEEHPQENLFTVSVNNE